MGTSAGAEVARQAITPEGRLRGSQRLQLANSVVSKFRAHFAKHGIAAIDQVYQSDPATYLRLAVSLVPHQIEAQVEHSLESGFADLLRRLNADPAVIEGEHTLQAEGEGRGGVLNGEAVPD